MTGVVDNGNEFIAVFLTLVINHTAFLPLVFDTGGKFVTGSNDSGDKFIAGVSNTSGKFIASVVYTSGEFIAGVNDIGAKMPETN